MKKIVGLLVVAILLGAGILKAQNHKGDKCGQDKGEKMEERSNKAKTELGLNEEQSTKWDAVHKDFKKEMKALRDDTSISDDEKKEKMKTLNQQKDDAIQAILSKDQMEKFMELKKEMRAEKGKGKGKGKGKKGGNKWTQVKADLNLSDDQSKKWDAIVDENRSKMQSLKSDDGLDEEAKKKEMKEMKGELKEQLMAILDSEQQATFKKEIEEMKQMRKQKREGNGQNKKID